MQEEGKKSKPCEDLGLMEEKLPRTLAGTYVQLQHRQLGGRELRAMMQPHAGL